MNHEDFYAHLEKLCKERDISQRGLSTEIDAESTYIGSTKSQGRLPSREMRDRIYKALGLTEGEFIISMEQKDSAAVLVNAEINRLMKSIEGADATLIIRYLQSIDPEEFQAFIAHLRKTLTTVKE